MGMKIEWLTESGKVASGQIVSVHYEPRWEPNDGIPYDGGDWVLLIMHETGALGSMRLGDAPGAGLFRKGTL